MKTMAVLAIVSASVSMQAIIPASAKDEIRHEVQQPTSGQEYTQRSAADEKNLNNATDQAPKIGHIGKDQTQSFRFGSGSRF